MDAQGGIGGDSELGVEVWRGGVNTWECDELGHMNVRFYVARAMEGLAGLAAAIDMPRAFSPRATATLLLRELHVRFLSEAMAAAPLHMRGWVVEMGESESRLVLVLYHSSSGEPSASFQMLVRHVTPIDGRAFPWPMATRERAAALTGPVPAFAAARGVDLARFETNASQERADALGLMTLGRGAVSFQECDVFGRIRPEQIVGRVSDGAPSLGNETQRIIAEGLDKPPARMGGAVLEYRLVYFDWPRAGDHFVIRSGLAGADSRVRRLFHWVLDPLSGRPWVACEAVAATLDLDLRKIVPITARARAALGALMTPDTAP